MKGGPGALISRGDLNLGGDLKFLGGPMNPSDAMLLKRHPYSGVSEPAVCRCSVKLVFLNNSQTSQRNTYVGVTFSRTPCLTEHLH